MFFRRRVFNILGIFFFLAIAAASLSAGGVKDPVLSKADQLIDERHYNEAIQLLTEYVDDVPDKFSEAQKRFQRIVKLREKFNVIADQLLDVLINTPEDDATILDLSNQLLALGSASDSSTQQFLNQVRALAAFNTNRKRLEQILEQARVFLAQGNYRDALASYSSGLDIYQDDFFNSGFGEDAENIAREGLQTLDRVIRSFNLVQDPFSLSASRLENLGKQNANPGEIRDSLDLLGPQMGALAGFRADFASVDTSYNAQLKILQEQDEMLIDRSFLAFALRLIHGPAGQNEGMIGTLDRFWEQKVSPAGNELMRITDQGYNAAHIALLNHQYDMVSPLLDTNSEYIHSSRALINYYLSFYESSGQDIEVIFGENVAAAEKGEFLKYRAMEKVLDFFRTSGDIGLRNQALGNSALSLWRQGTMNTASAISMEQNTRTELHARGDRIAVMRGAIDAEISDYRNYSENIQDPSLNPLTYLNHAKDIAGDLENWINAEEFNAFVRQYTIANEDLNQQLKVRENEFAQGNTFIQGVLTQIQSADGVREEIAYYPTEGLAALTGMSQNIIQDLGAGETLLSNYSGESAYDVGTEEGQALYAAAVSMMNRFQSLQAQAASISAAARVQIDRATALRLEGDRLYQESQAALGRNDFDVARDRLSLAQDRYGSSLAIQESASVRSTWDTRFLNLGQEIVRIENEIVVRDVRTLVNNARNYYYSGNFDQAEDALIRAQNRWHSTNAGDEPEVSYWLTMVRNAQSLSSGRVISVTAPLYAEMSQLLSDARLNYDEGVRLINASRRQEGLARFNDARNMTQKVELIFPLNREARLLDLRIEMYTDQNAFNASFRQRLNDAVAGTKPNVRSV